MTANVAGMDGNMRRSLSALSNANDGAIVDLWADPTTHRLLVDNAGSTGIASINADTTSAQLLVVGTAGTDFTIVDNEAGTHTFNLPNASATVRGVISTGNQVIAGIKFFTSGIDVGPTNQLVIDSSGNLSTSGTLAGSNFSGSSSGTNTGNQTSVSGNAGTATALQNARLIGGTSFNGTADITPELATTVTTNANLTGAIISSGNATSLGSFSSANLASALTDETGTGVNVFNTKPTFIGTINTIVAVAALALDGSLGSIFTKTIGTGSTLTQSNFSTGQCFLVTITGAFTVTWFSGITWITVGASAPTQAAITTYGFVYTGSNTFQGYLVGTQ